ncbi:UbiX family flavin prenyltransferase [Candidatus Aerophobetes bacterium]|nr:UbiX family flavin prenyltransferase [Candidatus Aerophobetes bacterium]
MRLVVGISGASGVIYGVRLLEELKKKKIETYLTITPTAEKILEYETDFKKEELIKLASHYCTIDDMFAPIASGSFKIEGCVIVPCSMRTIAGIAYGYSENLLLRVADVTLKEKRPLILVPRETPLSIIHLENMLRLAYRGANILPAMPAFYHNPKTLNDNINFIVGKILDILKIDNNLYLRWKEY